VFVALALAALVLLAARQGHRASAVGGEASILGSVPSRRNVEADLEQFATEMALALSSGCRPVEALRRCSLHRSGEAARRGFRTVLRIDRGLDALAGFQEASGASATQAEAALYAALAGELQNGVAAAPSAAAIARSASSEARTREADRAARAAPLVQLVVALGLVPSALLIGGSVVLAGLQSQS
jgi:tight adherence protein C